ncbi:hypothetical protein EBR57_03455 [bacterium]|nr:hypothetical protein [bacterium]
MSRPLVGLLNTDSKCRAAIYRELESTCDILEFESDSDLLGQYAILGYRLRVVIYCLNANSSADIIEQCIEINSLPDIVVIAHTGDTAEYANCIAAGASDYVRDIATLPVAIEQILEVSRFRQKIDLLANSTTQPSVPSYDTTTHVPIDLRHSAQSAISQGYSLFMKDIYFHFPKTKDLCIPSETVIPSSLIDSSEKLEIFVNRCICSANATSV